MKLGVDNFSLRFHDWDVFQYLEYAHSIGLDVVHFSDLAPFKQVDPGYLAAVKQTADKLGLSIEVGMGSICPTSTTFSNQRGTAVEQLTEMLRIAAFFGSPGVRCFLGANADRRTPLPLRAHVDATIATPRVRVRLRDTDAGHESPPVERPIERVSCAAPRSRVSRHSSTTSVTDSRRAVSDDELRRSRRGDEPNGDRTGTPR